MRTFVWTVLTLTAFCFVGATANADSWGHYGHGHGHPGYHGPRYHQGYSGWRAPVVVHRPAYIVRPAPVVIHAPPPVYYGPSVGFQYHSRNFGLSIGF